jgi:hypothetical protein
MMTRVNPQNPQEGERLNLFGGVKILPLTNRVLQAKITDCCEVPWWERILNFDGNQACLRT